MSRIKKLNTFKIVDSYLFLIFIGTIIMGIAYAQVNNELLVINGIAVVEPNSILRISNVSYSSNNGADVNNSVIVDYSKTMLHSNIVLGSNPSSTITYSVTIENDTDFDYAFVGTSYGDNFYSNENITYDLVNINVGETIASKQTKIFYITFRYTGNNTSNNILDAYIVFNFNQIYTIEYVLNNGTNNGNNPSTFIESNPVSILDPTRANCIFGGWYTNSSFTGDAITSTESLSDNTTLYAKWLININYTLAGGTQAPNQIMQFVETINEAILPATRQYYIFDGWYNSQNTLINSTSGLSLALRDLTAHWSLMLEKTTLSNTTFTASNVSGRVDYQDLLITNGTTYSYAGINKTGAAINNIRVTFTHSKGKGKSENITCAVYRSLSDYQNNTNLLGSQTQSFNKTTPQNINITLSTPIGIDEEFIILFTEVVPNSGYVRGLTISFNV